MTRGPERSRVHPEEARLNALAFRLAGAVALVAAGLFWACLFAVTRLPVYVGEAGDPAGYAIPGTHRTVDAAIGPVLAWCGGGAALLGVVCLGLAWLAPAAGRRPRTRPIPPPIKRSLKRPLLVLLAGMGMLIVALALRR